MKSFCAFFKKEWLELARTGKLTVLIILFLIFGIMNPAIAKLTPWLMKTLSGSLEGSGLTVTNITVDQVTSWTQFYKNIPVALIIFILFAVGSFYLRISKGNSYSGFDKGRIKAWYPCRKNICANAAVVRVLLALLRRYLRL